LQGNRVLKTSYTDLFLLVPDTRQLVWMKTGYFNAAGMGGIHSQKTAKSGSQFILFNIFIILRQILPKLFPILAHDQIDRTKHSKSIILI
jgi:hypothetical protein